MVLFPSLLATKHTKKTISSFNFVTLYQTNRDHNPHASTRQQSFDMVTLVLCDGGDAHVDLLRVQRHAQQHEESPQGIHELNQEKQGGFLGRSKREFCFIWPQVFGFRAWCLLPWVSWFGAKGLEWSRSKREIESERTQGAERDIQVRFRIFFPINLKSLRISLVFTFQSYLGNQHLECLKLEINSRTRAINHRVRDFSYSYVDKFSTWNHFYHVEVEFIILDYKLELQKLKF